MVSFADCGMCSPGHGMSREGLRKLMAKQKVFIYEQGELNKIKLENIERAFEAKLFSDHSTNLIGTSIRAFSIKIDTCIGSKLRVANANAFG